MNKDVVLGVDIGGSHITAALINIKNGCIIDGSLQRSKVNAQGSAEEIISSWCKVMQASLGCADHAGKIAIAMPGPFDYHNGISYVKDLGKFDRLYGLNVKSLILEALNMPIENIVFINDAACFLQGELYHGSVTDKRNVIGFTLGTGFGSATSINGLAQDAEYWKYPFMGGTCETFFSSRWFVAKYQQYSGKAIMDVKTIIDEVEIAEPMLRVFDEFSMNLGAFLSKLHKQQSFECAVIGGNIAKASTLFLPQLQSYLQARSVDFPIKISKLGEDAALIGAACAIA
ncbi:ROK family protein [Pedobacter sandarakinus]|uniref:ROK family protein n=1 Tax=Pedobacter sandarakinus TaxID=353156 RepID=UPI002247DE81|nr:ROK family protein [Pedobacter sandarakinus]MCX2574161.1 ROK family protein [Pedobacter sandarakinus]